MLEGKIPSALSKLSDLVLLNLSDNELSGEWRVRNVHLTTEHWFNPVRPGVFDLRVCVAKCALASGTFSYTE